MAAWPWFDVYTDRLLTEPRCRPSGPDAPAAGCIAHTRLSGIDPFDWSTVGLTPDGGTLLAVGGIHIPTSKKETPFLASVGVADGKERWRVPLPNLTDPMVSVSPGGGKAAVWNVLGEAPVYIVGVPDGALQGKVPAEYRYSDVVFSDDEASIVAGAAVNRRVISVSDPAAEPATAPGFDRPDCGGGSVGQDAGSPSNITFRALRSRDNGVAVFFRPRASDDDSLQGSLVSATASLLKNICGTLAVAIIPAVDSPLFASFSPRNNRLAVVYSGVRRPDTLVERTRQQLIDLWGLSGEAQSVVEIWKTGSGRWLQRIATFSIPGGVGHRIGWSQDEHRLAVVRTDHAGTDALIYWIP